MAGPLAPSIALLCKLGSIARHVEEATGDGAHNFDVLVLVSLVGDPEVQAWLGEMDGMALLPVARRV